MSEFTYLTCSCEEQKYPCSLHGYMRVEPFLDETSRLAPTSCAGEGRYFPQRPLTTHHEYDEAQTCMTSDPGHLTLANQSVRPCESAIYSPYSAAVDSSSIYQQPPASFADNSSYGPLHLFSPAHPSTGYSGLNPQPVYRSGTTPPLELRSQNYTASIPRNYATPSFMAAPSMPQTPRTLMASTLAPADCVGPYGSSGSHEVPPRNPKFGQSLPFEKFDSLKTIKCNGQTIMPEIHAQIVKNVFFHDNTWTCYRRNYISVECSYSLEPSADNARLYLECDGKENFVQIQALAVCLHASVDSKDGKAIELVQHTPKRDRGPQYAIRIEKLSPAPRGHPNAGYSTGGTAPLPILPHQLDEDYQEQSIASPNPKQSQHTFERVQFKQATANNGRRRAQQQYYHLILALYADIRNSEGNVPIWEKVAQQVSPTMVVRGRSPGHYSSEDSRGGGSRGPSGGSRGSRRASSQSYPYPGAQSSNIGAGSSSSYPNYPMGGPSTSYQGQHQYKYGQISPVSTLPTSSSSASHRRSFSNVHELSPTPEDVGTMDVHPDYFYPSALLDGYLPRNDLVRGDELRDSYPYSSDFSCEDAGHGLSPTWHSGNFNGFESMGDGHSCFQAPRADTESRYSYRSFSPHI